MSNNVITIDLINNVHVDVVYSFKKGKKGNGFDFEGYPNEIDVFGVYVNERKELSIDTLQELGLMDTILEKIEAAAENEHEISELEAKGFI